MISSIIITTSKIFKILSPLITGATVVGTTKVSGATVTGGEVPIIASVQVTVNGLTVPANTISNTNTVATIRFSGGTNNKTYKVICRITDSSNLTSERSVKLKIKEN